MVGQEVGSAAMMDIFAPFILSRTKGKERPAKLLPPPAHAVTISTFFSPNFSSCFLASRPIIVWCMSTWFKTLPREYRVSFEVTVSSTASLIASPRLPGESGFCSQAFLPALVSLLGLGTQLAPQVFIIKRR